MELLTTNEVAERLKTTAKDVCRLIRSGKLPARCLVIRGEGKHPRYRVKSSDFERYVENLSMAEVLKPVRTPKISPPRRRRSHLAGVIEFV